MGRYESLEEFQLITSVVKRRCNSILINTLC